MISNNTRGVTYRPLISAGTFLGVGLGGFLDGIVFHQILQLHNMLTGRIGKSTVAGMQVNMFWDGIFHLLTWTVTVIGLALLWRAGRRTDVAWSAKAFVGSMFLGWGSFNVAEGVINHHILHLHHVVESLGESMYDLAFLVSGILFIIGGFVAIRNDRTPELAVRPPTRSR